MFLHDIHIMALAFRVFLQFDDPVQATYPLDTLRRRRLKKPDFEVTGREDAMQL